MSTRGRRWAFVFGVLIALALPKHVECGVPDASCTYTGSFHTQCTSYEVEPFGFYLLEKLFDRDVGFAYTTGESCR
ncbi:MAG TPA: hypothetical protein VFQ53_08140 [Kofleriaceae bacterium]|nr:hypothetical protein [Kofleriaceae bacterium]